MNHAFHQSISAATRAPRRIGNSSRAGGRTVLLLALAALGTLLTTPASADAVTDWNLIVQDTVPAANPHFQSRAGAMVQLSVFETVNAITGDFEPYLGTVIAPAGASVEAAAVAAAYRTLITFHPGNAGSLDAARAASLAAIPDGPEEDPGVAAGEAASAALLQLRTNDGSATAQSVPYTPGTAPGDWQPAPPAFTPASLPGWGLVTRFGMDSGAQFRLPPPPPLNSGKYANDLHEVQLPGSSTAPADIRPPDRADVANFILENHLWPLEENANVEEVRQAAGRHRCLLRAKGGDVPVSVEEPARPAFLRKP